MKDLPEVSQDRSAELAAHQQYFAQKSLEKSGEYLRDLLRKIEPESAQVPLNDPEKEGPYLCWVDVGFPDNPSCKPEWIQFYWKGGKWVQSGGQPTPESCVKYWQEMPPKPAHL